MQCLTDILHIRKYSRFSLPTINISYVICILWNMKKKTLRSRAELSNGPLPSILYVYFNIKPMVNGYRCYIRYFSQIDSKSFCSSFFFFFSSVASLTLSLLTSSSALAVDIALLRCSFRISLILSNFDCNMLPVFCFLHQIGRSVGQSLEMV